MKGSTCDLTSNQCLECTTAAQCENPTPACGANQKCAACKTNADCNGSPDGKLCVGTGPLVGACVQCFADTDCTSDPGNPSCDNGIGRCVPRGTIGQHAPDGGPLAYNAFGFRPPQTNAACTVTSNGAASDSPAEPAFAVLFGATAVLAWRRRRSGGPSGQ
jgi:MYXO-CTERM domain-containing protein